MDGSQNGKRCLVNRVGVVVALPAIVSDIVDTGDWHCNYYKKLLVNALLHMNEFLSCPLNPMLVPLEVFAVSVPHIYQKECSISLRASQINEISCTSCSSRNGGSSTTLNWSRTSSR